MLLDVGSAPGLPAGSPLPTAPRETNVSEDLAELIRPGPWVGATLLVLSAGYLINALKR